MNPDSKLCLPQKWFNNLLKFVDSTRSFPSYKGIFQTYLVKLMSLHFQTYLVKIPEAWYNSVTYLGQFNNMSLPLTSSSTAKSPAGIKARLSQRSNITERVL